MKLSCLDTALPVLLPLRKVGQVKLWCPLRTSLLTASIISWESCCSKRASTLVFLKTRTLGSRNCHQVIVASNVQLTHAFCGFEATRVRATEMAFSIFRPSARSSPFLFVTMRSRPTVHRHTLKDSLAVNRRVHSPYWRPALNCFYFSPPWQSTNALLWTLFHLQHTYIHFRITCGTLRLGIPRYMPWHNIANI